MLAAESLYLYFYDMVNDGMRNDYANGRLLYADPMEFLDRMKTTARADVIYAPDTEAAVAEEIEKKNLVKQLEIEKKENETMQRLAPPPNLEALDKDTNE